MPDPESKKNQSKKGTNDPKEQRKPRQQRNQGAGERKSEKRQEPKVTATEKPVHEEPGPEFYKGLKRETDDILKITEEANSKYKKKEIQSNWAKYEVPIESYDEFVEQENLGADYEKLIEVPQSLGGHFQFKHEKSWDLNTGPSLYDSYFDINKNDLPTALCTIPFYERNGIDKDIFSETDIQTMDQRTSMYKHKYFKISTVESELQNKLINSLKDDYSKIKIHENRDEKTSESEKDYKCEDEICFDESKLNQVVSKDSQETQEEFIFKKADEFQIEPIVNENNKSRHNEVIENIEDIIGPSENVVKGREIKKVAPVIAVSEAKIINETTPAPTQHEPEKKIIESPEDLEKWLDDFLDD